MRTFPVHILIVLLLLSAAQTAHAHQPRLVYGVISSPDDPIPVPDPEISKAYYGELSGEPAYYNVSSGETFYLYVNILSPDIPVYNRTDHSVEVRDSRNNLVLELNGSSYSWKRFYEGYGGDWYLQGPEARGRLPGGSYLVKVYNAENVGRYSLALGEEESFPPEEMINAFFLVPQIKQSFFGRSLLESYFNVYGLSFLLALLLLTASIYAAYWFFVVRRRKPRIA